MQVDTFQVESFPNLDEYLGIKTDKKLRVCIATEEILGPVRNGGIASTYYHLARGLVAQGHEVSILYLKGKKVEDETPQHWAEHFSSFGISLHYLEFIPQAIIGPSQNWQGRYSAAYQWLKGQDRFDVVHTSEWRGGLIYALMAKRLGLAFQDTLFIVKASSPHLWNRHYQMLPIAKKELLPAAFAEQKCVELADMVIGGSAHLLCFMKHIGYRLPRASYVQPNILDFTEVHVKDGRPPRLEGDIVKTRELTFFGRLDARKGIELFCAALDILQRNNIRPVRVNFLGKFGDSLPNQKNEKVADYIERKSRAWDFDVHLYTGLNQPEALSFLCSRDMFAVMPSLIENSTMAVYETLENKIPFIATKVGGTSELIDSVDHASCLIAPTSAALAQRLEEILDGGLRIARPAFDSKANLQAWYGFHATLAEEFGKLGGQEAIARLTGKAKSMRPLQDLTPGNRIAAVVLLRDTQTLKEFTNALLDDPPDAVYFVVTEPALERAAYDASQCLIRANIDASVVEYIGYPAGEALSRAIRNISLDATILCDGTTTCFAPGFCSDLRKALQVEPNVLITSFVAAPGERIAMPLGNDIVSEIACGGALGAEVVCIPRKVADKVGDFMPYDFRHGLIQEYVLRAGAEHGIDFMVIPECRLKSMSYLEDQEEIRKNPNSTYLRAMPLIEHPGISYRKLALLSPTLTGGEAALRPEDFRDNKRATNEIVWLVHADRSRALKYRSTKISLGLDEEKSELVCFAVGVGARSLWINGEKVPIDLESRNGDATLHRFQVPADWVEGRRYNVRFVLESEKEKLFRFLRINKISGNVFAVVSSGNILNVENTMSLFKNYIRSIIKSPDDNNATEKAININYNNKVNTLYALCQKNLEKLNRNLIRNIRGYAGSPVKASIPPRGLYALDPEYLEGWAWNRENKSELLTIVMELNGQPVEEAPANLFIKRFGSRQKKLAYHGFRLPLSAEVKKDNARVDIRVKETGALVKNGKLIFVSGMFIAVK